LGTATQAFPCSVVGPLPTPEILIQRAALIVHVKADRQGPGLGKIRFRVIGVHKGSLSSRELVLNGRLDDADDFNDRPIPYRFVRPGGRSGNCYAHGYRKGAEYLLLLQSDSAGVWSPYWAALSLTNEQIRGTVDPWLTWVVEQIKQTPSVSLPRNDSRFVRVLDVRTAKSPEKSVGN
jgi:hypothetical protein